MSLETEVRFMYDFGIPDIVTSLAFGITRYKVKQLSKTPTTNYIKITPYTIRTLLTNKYNLTDQQVIQKMWRLRMSYDTIAAAFNMQKFNQAYQIRKHIKEAETKMKYSPAEIREIIVNL